MPPRSTWSRIAVVVALGAGVACSTAGETADAAADTAAGTAAVASADAPSSGASCFVRGASLEEARTRTSPLGELRFTLGEDEGLLCYGRPSANGRVVMGELVPYGEPWRLGANEATVIHLPFPAEIGDVAVEPGAYSLYAIPGESEWQIVVNRQAERWGIPINDGVRSADVGTFTRPATRIEQPVEQLEFTWQPHGEGMGHLVMQWENTQVEIPVHRREG